MEINERFPVLSTIAKFLWAVGIIVIIIGAIPFIKELIEVIRYFTTSGAQWVWTMDDFIRIGTFVLSLVIGLFIMAIAESIGVLFAIEKSTRR